jgi:hypothetical protein
VSGDADVSVSVSGDGHGDVAASESPRELRRPVAVHSNDSDSVTVP